LLGLFQSLFFHIHHKFLHTLIETKKKKEKCL
jgi:hypothetical protein